MKVTLWPGDKGGCAFHRIRLPAGICRANGLDVEILDKVPARLLKDGNYKVVTQGIETDVLVIQRPVYQYIVEAIPEFQKDGIAVVVEIDDDLEALSKNHIAHDLLHPKKSKVMNWGWTRKALEMCDYITCTTRALAYKYDSQKTALIPNYIPREITEIDLMPPDRVVGWTSNVATHPNDLQQTRGGVAAAIQSEKAALFVVGDPHNVAKHLGCSKDVKVISPGWVDLDEYYFWLRAAKVGIVPLDLGPFNEAKSNLKGLEFAAMGVPFVASPTQEYLSLAARGAGVIAQHSADWYAAVSHYLKDDLYRNEVGRQARETVKKHYLLEDHWHLYPEAWEKALKLKRGTEVAA